GTFAIERVAERIEHAAEHRLAYRHRQQPAKCLYLVTLFDLEIITQNDNADAVLFEVEGQAADAAGELDHLSRHAVRPAIDAGDAVAHFQDRADLADVDRAFVLLNLGLNDRGNFIGVKFHNSTQHFRI